MKRRVFRARPQPLILVTNAYSLTASVNFRGSVPDPRLWVRTGVIFIGSNQIAGVTPDGSPALWMSLTEGVNDRGAGGDSGTRKPVRNLVGTQVAPLAIPTDVGLYGHVVEFQSGCTGFQGALTLPGPTSHVGTWYALAAWSAYSGVICDDEWDAIEGECVLTTDQAVALS